LAETLKRAKESAPPRESLQPLVDQLDRSAIELRSSGNDREAIKVERAVASIKEAGAEDFAVIDEATSTVTKQVFALFSY
jgi:hypothetical protein